MSRPTPTLEQIINMKLDEKNSETENNNEIDEMMNKLQSQYQQHDINTQDIQLIHTKPNIQYDDNTKNMYGVPFVLNKSNNYPPHHPPQQQYIQPPPQQQYIQPPLQQQYIQPPLQQQYMNHMNYMNSMNPMNPNMQYLPSTTLDNDKNDQITSKQMISYIKNPFIVFIIFILLNSSICVTCIDNVFSLCDDKLANIINLIVRGILASLLFFIISSLLHNL